MKYDMKKVLSLLNAGNIKYMYNLCLAHAKSLTLNELRKLDKELNKVTTLHFMMDDGSYVDLSKLRGELKNSSSAKVNYRYHTFITTSSQYKTTLYHWLEGGAPTSVYFYDENTYVSDELKYKGSFTYDYGDVDVVLTKCTGDEEEKNKDKKKEEKTKTEDSKKEDENTGSGEYAWVRTSVKVDDPPEDIHEGAGGYRKYNNTTYSNKEGVFECNMSRGGYFASGGDYDEVVVLKSSCTRPKRVLKAGETVTLTINSSESITYSGDGSSSTAIYSSVTLHNWDGERVTNNGEPFVASDGETTSTRIDPKTPSMTLPVSVTMPEGSEGAMKDISFHMTVYANSSFGLGTQWIYEWKIPTAADYAED